jgi:imidazolonepropionase-like amidohydrolase
MEKIIRPLWPTLILFSASLVFAQPQQYDLLLQGGHVIDAKNNIDAVRDVAIRDGKIAAVAARIDPAQAFKVVNVGGLYVTPGLVDIHVHVYAGTGEPRSYAGDNSLYPDGYTFRVACNHGRRRRLRRLAELRGLQSSASSIAPKRGSWRSSISLVMACAGRSMRTNLPTWRPSQPPKWRCGTKA